jgi:hypothetical protein
MFILLRAKSQEPRAKNQEPGTWQFSYPGSLLLVLGSYYLLHYKFGFPHLIAGHHFAYVNIRFEVRGIILKGS